MRLGLKKKRRQDRWAHGRSEHGEPNLIYEAFVHLLRPARLNIVSSPALPTRIWRSTKGFNYPVPISVPPSRVAFSENGAYLPK